MADQSNDRDAKNEGLPTDPSGNTRGKQPFKGNAKNSSTKQDDNRQRQDEHRIKKGKETMAKLEQHLFRKHGLEPKMFSNVKNLALTYTNIWILSLAFLQIKVLAI